MSIFPIIIVVVVIKYINLLLFLIIIDLLNSLVINQFRCNCSANFISKHQTSACDAFSVFVTALYVPSDRFKFM